MGQPQIRQHDMNIAFANLRTPVHDNLKAIQKTTANNFGIGAHVGIDNVGGSLSYSRLAKGSKEERANARKEAQKIIGQIIPENQKKWK